MNISSFFDREQYPISHGNWERRWKISISGNKLRWTIKTSSGITDLDSETPLVANILYNVTALFSGTDMEIYLNGALDAFRYWSGNILGTNVDLTIAQTVPGDNNYNFKGVLDEIRIYDYALPLEEIEELYDFVSEVEANKLTEVPNENFLFQNYPNPFNSETNIQFHIYAPSRVKLEVFNIIGEKIITLLDENRMPGNFNAKWTGKDERGNKVNSGIYFIRLHAGNYSSIKKMAFVN